MLTIEVPVNPYDREKLYSKVKHTFNTGITILVGKNGAGKSTLLYHLKQHCNKANIPLFYYDNYFDGGERAKSKYSFFNDFETLSAVMQKSEGQQIYMNFSYMMSSLGAFVAKHKEAKQVVLAFDAIDSGLDLANIAEIKQFLENEVMQDLQNTDVYILITANSYGFVKGSRCYDVAHNKEITFKSYEDFEKFILKQAKK